MALNPAMNEASNAESALNDQPSGMTKKTQKDKILLAQEILSHIQIFPALMWISVQQKFWRLFHQYHPLPLDTLPAGKWPKLDFACVHRASTDNL